MIEASRLGAGSGMRAYRHLQNLPATPVTVPSMVGPEASNKPSFADMVEKSAVSAIETIRHGDRAAVMGMRGEISTQEVIEATMEMESQIKMVVAVRDKMVDALQELMRMAV